MAHIVDMDGKEHEVYGTAKLPVERIAETKNFVVEQDFEYPIKGFYILVAKRHITSILEFSEEERKECMEVLYLCRKGMKDVLGIEEVTLVQEETGTTSHFHVWLFPWLATMESKKKKVEDVMHIMRTEKEREHTPEEVEDIRRSASSMQEYFTTCTL